MTPHHPGGPAPHWLGPGLRPSDAPNGDLVTDPERLHSVAAALRAGPPVTLSPAACAALADLLDTIAGKEDELRAGPFWPLMAAQSDPLFELHPFGYAQAGALADAYLADLTPERTP